MIDIDHIIVLMTVNRNLEYFSSSVKIAIALRYFRGEKPNLEQESVICKLE